MATEPVEAVPDVFVYARGDRPQPDTHTVNTTSKSRIAWQKGLSPFFLTVDDVPLRPGGEVVDGVLFENLWQGLKVYAEDVDKDGNPTDAYWAFRERVFRCKTALRFPKGRGAKPLYALPLHGKGRLGYVESRIKTYAPLYEAAVTATPAFKQLQEVVKEKGTVWLFDFDGNACLQQGKSLGWMMYNTKRKMGHGFVLAGILRGERPWKSGEYDAAKEHASSIPRTKPKTTPTIVTMLTKKRAREE